MISQTWTLKSYPAGMPTADNFELISETLPAPEDGEVQVKNLWLSVDPYMRGRMTGVKSYADPYIAGEPMTGGAVGEVVASGHPDYKAGDNVVSAMGWREGYTARVDALSQIGFRKIDTSLIPAKAYLGVAGMPGLTAYAGLYDVAAYKAGETVLVSGGAGAVGSTVTQLAAADGSKVIALAGTDEKCAWLESHGAHKAINYKTAAKTHGSLTKAILNAAPDGIDVYFENVGGDMLEAALNVMKPFGRIAVCGMISQYNNATPAPGPTNLIQIVGKSLKIQGFIVIEHQHCLPDYIGKLGPLMATGKLVSQDTITQGIDSMPQAFFNLFTGAKSGKMLVKL